MIKDVRNMAKRLLPNDWTLEDVLPPSHFTHTGWYLVVKNLITGRRRLLEFNMAEPTESRMGEVILTLNQDGGYNDSKRIFSPSEREDADTEECAHKEGHGLCKHCR